MRVCFSIIAILCFVGSLSAQNRYRITGKVLDKDSKAVEFASVTMAESQSAVKKLIGTTTGEDGSFLLNAKEASYTIEVSLIGYEKYTLNISLDKDIDLGVITLKEDVKTLKSIKVTANRVEYNMDGYEYRIGNIEALKKKDLTEILRTAPGISVASRVMLYGSPVVNIYVDRRRISMTEDALMAYLQSYKGDNIEKIEVISNPDISARHSGISLKIITKKQERGFLSAMGRTSVNRDNFVVGSNLNLDYRRGKFSFYSSGSYMHQYRQAKEVTNYLWKSSRENSRDITTEKTRLPLSANGTFGIGYDLSKNDYISAEVSFREIDKDIKRKISAEKTGSLTETSFRDYKTSAKTPTASVLYSHKFKDASELTLTGDYVGSYNNNDITTGKISAGGTKEPGTLAETENNTSTFAFYSNYSKRIKKKHSINVGMRYSYIKNEAVNNDLRFAYNEGLLRPFASYSVNLKKFGFRAGIQGDWANIDHNNFVDILPTVSANWYINRKKGHTLNASYSMGAARPSISQLNPNAVLSEKDIIVRVGNPDLKSYNSHNFSASLRLFNSYSISANYRMADDAITAYLYTDEDGTIYQTYTNNASSQSASVGMGIYKNLFNNRLNLNLDASYSYSESKVDKDTKRNNSFSCALVANLSLPKSFSISAEAFANSRKRIGHNAYKKEPFELYLGISKTVRRWNFKFKVYDVFNSFTKGANTYIDMGSYTRKLTNHTMSRSYAFTVTYNFNWGKAQRARKSNTQKADLNSRIGD